MQNWHKIILSTLVSILFWLAWEPIGLGFTAFIALIPLFILHFNLAQTKFYHFTWLFLSLLLWNILTTWWVWNSTPSGAITMLIMNSLLMYVPFWLSKRIFKLGFFNLSILTLIVSWLALEHIHHRWDISWPWLSLGNAFSGQCWFIQWYEYTGIAGGSLLIWLINVAIYIGIKNKNNRVKIVIFGCSLILLLCIFSLYLQNSCLPKSNQKREVAVLQPNYDPFTEKFELAPEKMISEMLVLSKTKLLPTTDFLLWPETALVDNIDVDYIEKDYQINLLQGLKNEYKNLQIYTGADAQKIYTNTLKKPEKAARQFKGAPLDFWWVFYNASFYLGDSVKPKAYFKSKLVPGTEIMPFISIFPFIEKLAVSLDENSATGTLGITKSQNPFKSKNGNLIPSICYESIYGEHIGKFVKNGGEFIAVITNDGWWGNTDGHKQHWSYSRLRAIETRKWVARSANTGISGFISPDGKDVIRSKYGEKTILTQSIWLNNKITFYAKYGDFIGYIASFLSIIVLLVVLTPTFLIKKLIQK